MISILIALILLGLLLYIVSLLPIDGTVKRIVHAVAIVMIVIWILQGFGFLGRLPAWR